MSRRNSATEKARRRVERVERKAEFRDWYLGAVTVAGLMRMWGWGVRLGWTRGRRG